MPHDEATVVRDVLCEAFYDYPVMRYVLRDSSDDYDRHITILIGFFVMARVFRGELLLGVRSDEGLDAAALVSYPENTASRREAAALRGAVWAELGDAARSRYESCGVVWEPMQVEVPHIHLNMIGVRRSAQGRRLGRTLLEHVQELSRRRPGSQGVSLTTEDRENVRLYQHVGYQVVGHARISPELETWAMFRPD